MSGGDAWGACAVRARSERRRRRRTHSIAIARRVVSSGSVSGTSTYPRKPKLFLNSMPLAASLRKSSSCTTPAATVSKIAKRSPFQ